MVRTIPIGLPGLIGKCSSIFLWYIPTGLLPAGLAIFNFPFKAIKSQKASKFTQKQA